ncbi:hypothetical protein EV702DRAFT_966959 [Suillus placidus]|uniref:F-box domain-containing protein n=1 Tax=Suillus placidus TaxID=48579 RepID=A0A9P6ZZD2_9AGAM|nr:hypothetical protein EV702DRAFT_966959 [Suillus placidus]
MRSPHAITRKQQELKEILDELDSQTFPQIFEDFTIFDRRPNPLYDLNGIWFYGIDLDQNVFRVNGIPFYSLECLPGPEHFLEHISEDHYENLACAPGCPPKHKYKRLAAPVVDDSDLETYRSLACTGSDAALSSLLGINDILSTNEQVRVSLLEMMVGQCLARANFQLEVGQLIYEFESISNHNQLMDHEWLAAYSLVSFAFIPQMFDASSVFVHPTQLSRKEFIWVREDTVLCLAAHLDDKRCLQASVSRLIGSILEQQDAPGDYFGIAFSISHCAIVKVVKDAHTTTFSHTAALQYLPSFFAESPSTPGITALARLGYRIDPALFVRAMEIWRGRGRKGTRRVDHKKSFVQGVNDPPPSVNSAALPPELWQEIAFHLDLQDVLTLGLVSRLCREVASMVLRYPYVLGHRLVAVSEEMPDNPLHAASFSAARAGTRTTLFVGQSAPESEVACFPLYSTRPDPGFYVYVSGTIQPVATGRNRVGKGFHGY